MAVGCETVSVITVASPPVGLVGEVPVVVPLSQPARTSAMHGTVTSARALRRLDMEHRPLRWDRRSAGERGESPGSSPAVRGGVPKAHRPSYPSATGVPPCPCGSYT